MSQPPRKLTKLLKESRSRLYPRGQIMLYKGDVPLEVLIIKSGIVKIYDVDDSNNEKVLQLVKPWGIVPLAIFSGKNVPTQWFYSALTDCEVGALPADQLIEQMKNDTELTLSLMNWFSRETHELLIRLSSMSKSSAREKMMAALKFLVKHHAQQRSRSQWYRVTFPVNHQLLANMTGITRESAAATMKLLQDEHISRYPRQTVLELNARRLGQKV